MTVGELKEQFESEQIPDSCPIVIMALDATRVGNWTDFTVYKETLKGEESCVVELGELDDSFDEYDDELDMSDYDGFEGLGDEDE